uniref:Uncharacterized protein n=1 Tax=Rhizophora mucronata TaxID=61149 RepID=A0A2P2IRZ1_RHIMU
MNPQMSPTSYPNFSSIGPWVNNHPYGLPILPQMREQRVTRIERLRFK